MINFSFVVSLINVSRLLQIFFNETGDVEQEKNVPIISCSIKSSSNLSPLNKTFFLAKNRLDGLVGSYLCLDDDGSYTIDNLIYCVN